MGKSSSSSDSSDDEWKHLPKHEKKMRKKWKKDMKKVLKFIFIFRIISYTYSQTCLYSGHSRQPTKVTVIDSRPFTNNEINAV